MRGEDKPSTLDLIFTKTENEIDNISYEAPLGNSDHVTLRFDFLAQYNTASGKDTHKEDRLDYRRGTTRNSRKYTVGETGMS